MSTRTLDAASQRAAALAGYRVIVCDNETTGLDTVNSRVVSVALHEIVAGRVMGGYATLVDPGLATIGATRVHGITNDTLRAANAPSFITVAPHVLARLDPEEGSNVIFVGFNVIFDALMLHAELARLGQAFPTIYLLDVAHLAHAAGVPADSLRVLAQALRLENYDPHTAMGDTSVTTQALLRLLDRLAGDPQFSIDDYLTLFDPSLRITRKGTTRKATPREELSEAHALSHQLDLTNKRTREKALAICVDENCEDLYQRCHDGIIDKGRARQVAEWVAVTLQRDDLTRVTRGRLLSALAGAAGETEDGAYIRATFDWVVPWLDEWGTCTRGDNRCDRCAKETQKRACRFQAVKYALVAAFMYEDNVLSEDRAKEFLPFTPPGVKRGRGRPATGWFGQLVRAGDLDTAGYGAHLVAKTGTVARTSGYERLVLAHAWDAGSRNAVLADEYSKCILADGSPDPAKPHLDLARQVCADGLATVGASSRLSVADRLTDRLARIDARIEARATAAARPEPAFTRNGRAPRPTLIAPAR